MPGTIPLLVWKEGDRSFGLGLEAVRRVVRVVEWTPFPEMPPGVLGALDYHGELIPVVSLSRAFGQSAPELALSDQLIIAEAGRAVAFTAQTVPGLLECEEQDIASTDEVLPQRGVAAVARGPEGLVLVPDIGALLLPDMEALAGGSLPAER